MNNILPTLRGLNFWTLKQKIKDHTIQRVSTIQLLYRIDIYEGFTDAERAYLQTISDPKQQQAYIKAHGKLSKTTGEMKSHSFTLQFQQLYIEGTMAHANGIVSPNYAMLNNAIKDTTGNLQYGMLALACQGPTSYSGGYLGVGYILGVNAGTTVTTYGILCGIGNTAPANTDYKMQTLIANGSSSGQLQYQATSTGSAGIVGSNVDTVIVRTIVNSSGGTITISEVGLVTQTGYTYNYNFLIAHDAVSQAVNAGAVAIVSYDIRTTV